MCKAAHTADRPTIYVDGGTKFRGRKVLEDFPTISVGDGDSGQANLDVRLPPDKDYSDLAFALRGLPETIREVQMLGFLGGRRDHELMVLGEVHHFLTGKGKFTMVRLDNEVFAFSGGPLKMEVEGRFSLAVLEPAAVTVTGACRYQLKTPTPLRPLSSHGLSNEGNGMVTVTATSPCFLLL
jgi:thiamine pyrophosphokinase